MVSSSSGGFGFTRKEKAHKWVCGQKTLYSYKRNPSVNDRMIVDESNRLDYVGPYVVTVQTETVDVAKVNYNHIFTIFIDYDDGEFVITKVKGRGVKPYVANTCYSKYIGYDADRLFIVDDNSDVLVKLVFDESISVSGDIKDYYDISNEPFGVRVNLTTGANPSVTITDSGTSIITYDGSFLIREYI